MRQLDAFEQSNDGKLQKTTARQFLKQMELLGPVVIQDVAAMKLLHPERFENCPLINDPLFQTPAFEVSLVVSAFPLPANLLTMPCLLSLYYRPSHWK